MSDFARTGLPTQEELDKIERRIAEAIQDSPKEIEPDDVVRAVCGRIHGLTTERFGHEFIGRLASHIQDIRQWQMELGQYADKLNLCIRDLDLMIREGENRKGRSQELSTPSLAEDGRTWDEWDHAKAMREYAESEAEWREFRERLVPARS